MACELSGSLVSVEDWLVWPSGCSYYFYLWIIGGLMVIISWILFKAEEKRTGEADYISAIGTSSIAMVVLTAIGTLIEDTAGIPMIQLDILLYVLAVAIPIILIWIFKD